MLLLLKKLLMNKIGREHLRKSRRSNGIIVPSRQVTIAVSSFSLCQNRIRTLGDCFYIPEVHALNPGYAPLPECAAPTASIPPHLAFSYQCHTRLRLSETTYRVKENKCVCQETPPETAECKASEETIIPSFRIECLYPFPGSVRFTWDLQQKSSLAPRGQRDWYPSC